MTPPENETLSFLKEYIWPVIFAVGALIGSIGKWVWVRNEEEHEKIRELINEKHEELQKAHFCLKEATSEGHSSLNDKFMEHVDLRLESALKLMREGDLRNSDHIAKLFDKLEQHGQRSEDRHRELMTALHTGLAGKADK